MALLNGKCCHDLNDGYVIQFVPTSTHQLRIEIHQDQALKHVALLHDKQCFAISNGFCSSTKDLQELLIDILTMSPSSILMLDSNHLDVAFPVYYGIEKSRCKKWSFKIDLMDISLIDEKSTKEVSLDPQDWYDTRALGHQILDDMVDYIRDVRLRAPWRPMPQSVRQAIRETEIPLHGQSPWEVYHELRTLAIPYPVGNHHPHYWGYVQGTGSMIGAFAELITGAMNTMSWGGHQASIHLERQVLSWLKVLMGFPNDDTSSGVLVSGTSVATIIAMAVARKKFINQKMKIYLSKEAHNCLTRAVDLLNLGRENMIYVPTNAQHQIDTKALRAAIDPDSCGVIVGTAGTVGDGAVDDLESLANICAERPNELWFHVDGAIGAVARCSKRLRPLFQGMERADSIAFDLHKWLFVPYECGCILIRDGPLHKATFSQPPASYLTLMNGGITPSEGEIFYSDYGLELSRGTKALKVWMTLKTFGIEHFGRIMEQNVDQVQYFARLIEQHSDQFEVLTTGPLNIINFRCIVSRSHPVELDHLNKFNKHLLVTMQERGYAVVSPLVVHSDTFALRMCITNHRTKLSDMDIFMKRLVTLVNELLSSSEYSYLNKKSTD